MPRLSANLSLLFTELPLEERFAAAAAEGFKGVEIQFLYEFSAQKLRDAADAAKVEIMLFNFPAGNLAAGDIGIAALPGREEGFRDGVRLAYSYHQILKTNYINILAGKPPVDVSRDIAMNVLEENVRFALDMFADDEVTLVLEPVNSVDHPNFLLQRTEDAAEVITRIGAPNLMIQFDIYHRQIMQGNLMDALVTFLPLIGHIQFADVPGRHQPNTGEINFPAIFRLLDDIGYKGWVGAEYIPSTSTSDSFAWLRDL